jgi:hypothetical protein
VITELALLSAWENGYGRPAPDRAVTLAAAASGLPPDHVADLPLGACDRLLLELREQCFGTRLDGLARCPQCGTELDVGLDLDELRAGPDGLDGADGGRPVEVAGRTVDVAGRTVTLRALTSRDIGSCGGDRDRLLARCLVGEPAPPAAEVLDAVEARLDALDPQAARTIDLDCPSCRVSWAASVDVTEFVWTEVDRFARRLLHDIHTLATAYGWREADVLAISPARRRFYLQACTS